jgi:DNA repair protein RadC
MAVSAGGSWLEVEAKGLSGASATELLALGLAKSREDYPHFEETAKEILKKSGGIKAIRDLSVDLLRQEAGLTGDEAFRVLALIELGRRIAPMGKGQSVQIYDSRSVYEMLRPRFVNEKREHFMVVLLDAQNVVMRTSTVHIGTLTSSLVGPREVFREAIREGASSIVVAHNHPSGSTDPSSQDIEVTERLAEVGRMLDIPLLDHVILGEGYTSLRDRGILK